MDTPRRERVTRERLREMTSNTRRRLPHLVR